MEELKGWLRRDIEKRVKIYKQQQQVCKGDHKIHRDKCKAFVLLFEDGQLFGQRLGNFQENVSSVDCHETKCKGFTCTNELKSLHSFLLQRI